MDDDNTETHIEGLGMSWRRRTPYITAYNELSQKHYDDIKELKQQVSELQWMVEYMAAKMFSVKKEGKE